ncbi:HAMP domain-containing sensor histidine kinase [Pedobacter sp. L105]|uniref:sensor histidine kinase n=1 Tax=Pedobacter sp. L105 TaxID=1641871 RepID=UPI00131A933C|nr:HAMP domain-containing sensor histidine kinase [Pedobacter sp. L105]
MTIRNRLSLQFTFMFAVLLLFALTGIYFFVEHNWVKNFYTKLNSRAVTISQFYLAEDNLSKEKFEHVLKRFPQSLTDERISIYDANFKARFIPEDSIHWDSSILKSVVANKEIYFRQGERQVTGIYYVDNSGPFIILVSAIDEQGHHDRTELAFIMLAFFLISLIITFFSGKIFSRLALSPILGITNQLKIIRSSSLNHRLAVSETHVDEIDILSIGINNLLEHLEQSFDSQEAFIANASHELRTPITTIMGEAEISLMNERSSQDYKQTLVNIIKETERLNFIINSLMDLVQTNISNNAFQDISMDELLWEVVDEMCSKHPDRIVEVNYNHPEDHSVYTIQGNRQLLFIAINNILKNAIKFSDGKIVHCEIFADAKGVHIIIKDEGIGIPAADLNKIFQPFFRSSTALSFAGYGIGLSLTQNIMRLHNGRIKVKSEPGLGTEFHLIFPAY